MRVEFVDDMHLNVDWNIRDHRQGNARQVLRQPAPTCGTGRATPSLFRTPRLSSPCRAERPAEVRYSPDHEATGGRSRSVAPPAAPRAPQGCVPRQVGLTAPRGSSAACGAVCGSLRRDCWL
jgi:hypothetical protein